MNATMNDWKDEILKKWSRKLKTDSWQIHDGIRDRLAREFDGEVLYREPMSKHTSMRVGGPADVYLKPANAQALSAAIRIAREEEIPWMVTGWGSNTLVRDEGIRGFVVTTQGALQDLQIVSENEDGVDVFAGAGVGITAFVNFTRDQSLTGVETWIGIPGSMGGAIVMNAGARGVEVQDVVREIQVVDDEGVLQTISREKLDFEYRHLKIPKNLTVVGGLFRLEKGNTEEITSRIREYQKKRVDTQPLNYPNLGSIFKNPVPERKNQVLAGAGQLIEEAGLKNIRVGGARISEKHANFIINEKNATARDVEVLIGLVRDRIKESTGIVLETEVKIVGV